LFETVDQLTVWEEEGVEVAKTCGEEVVAEVAKTCVVEEVAEVAKTCVGEEVVVEVVQLAVVQLEVD
jgi:hypothetical protein